MNKLTLFICSGIAVLAMSCTKEVEGTSYVEQGRDDVGLTVRVTTGSTRAADTSLEDEIASLQVFIFADGVLESVAYSEADSVSLRCFSGYKSIYAVVNNPKIGWTPDMTISELENTIVMLSEESTWNVMVGSDLNVYVAPEAMESPVLLTVQRLSARICLNFVTNGTSTDEDESITVHCAYITNVAGVADLSGTVSLLEELTDSTMWYNKMGNMGNLPAILSSGDMSSVTVKQGEVVSIGQYFYCYPNPYNDDDDWTTPQNMFNWSPRCTRLVVEAEYKGVLCYYPVTIKGVTGGVSYNVMLTIEGYGAADPEGYVWYYVDLETGELVTGTGGSSSGNGSGSGHGGGSGGSAGGDDLADPFIPNVESYEGDVVPFHGGSAKVLKYNLCM